MNESIRRLHLFTHSQKASAHTLPKLTAHLNLLYVPQRTTDAMKGGTSFAFVVQERSVNSSDGVLIPIPMHHAQSANVVIINMPDPIVVPLENGHVIGEEAECCHDQESFGDLFDAVELNHGEDSEDKSHDSVSTAGCGSTTVATEACIADNHAAGLEMLKCNFGCDAALAAEDHNTCNSRAPLFKGSCNLDCLLSELLDELCHDVATLGRRGEAMSSWQH
jgi:hypothetical protein